MTASQPNIAKRKLRPAELDAVDLAWLDRLTRGIRLRGRAPRAPHGNAVPGIEFPSGALGTNTRGDWKVAA